MRLEPLVDQQAKACHDVCGIPQSDVSVLYGDVSQQKREAIVSCPLKKQSALTVIR